MTLFTALAIPVRLAAQAKKDGNVGPRFIDDSKVTDHHAIIPTAISPEKTGLSAEESKIYDLICRRLLSAWQVTE
jgi:DNA topoisomerase-3